MSHVNSTAICASGAVSRIHLRRLERARGGGAPESICSDGGRWQRRLRETGSVRPEVQGRPAGQGKLAAHRAFLEELVAQDGDITLPELSGTLEAATGVAAHAASIGRFLRKLGYLPPYSPDLNPIEMAFSKLKAHLRRIGARTFDQMFEALAEICDMFTPHECWNSFCGAGYGSG